MMTSKLQKRLIGIVMLVTIMATILTLLFEGKKKPQTDRQHKTSSVAITLLPDSQNELTGDFLSTVDEPLPTAASLPSSQKALKKTLNSQMQSNQMYVVQLAALKNVAKTNEIVAKLRSAKLNVFTTADKSVEGEINRIFIGPEASKKSLQLLLGELKTLTGLDGQIKIYDNFFKKNNDTKN